MSIIAILFACTPFLSAFQLSPASHVLSYFQLPQQKEGIANSDHLFAKLETSLSQKTKVPLRLPGYIPDDGDKDNPLYAILKSADEDGYEIEIAWTDDCTGGNACHYGTVRGSMNPLVENAGRRIPVLLAKGIKGYFIEATCGAHCDDSAIGWRENQYHYSISTKAERKASLIKVANSAILYVSRGKK